MSRICSVQKGHFDVIVILTESGNDPPDRGYVIRSVLNTFFVSVSNFSFLDAYSSFLTLSDITISQKTSPDKHDILNIQIRVAGRKSLSRNIRMIHVRDYWQHRRDETCLKKTDILTSRIWSFTLSDEHPLLISARFLSLWSASHFRWSLSIFLSSTPPTTNGLRRITSE